LAEAGALRDDLQEIDASRISRSTRLRKWRGEIERGALLRDGLGHAGEDEHDETLIDFGGSTSGPR
jgi:hypothetical protein